MLKRKFTYLYVLVIVTMACGLPLASTSPTNPAPTPTNTLILPSETPLPVTETPTAMPSETAPSTNGLAQSYGPLSIDLPVGLASGISGEQFSPMEGGDVPPWGLTPGHTQIELNGYPLQGKFHQPRIYIYPAQGYAELFPAAFESIRRLDNILYAPDAPDMDEPLPTIPFFPAAQVFASQIQAIYFQNGGGVRLVTEYAQYAAPVNNQELFYLFQGLTRDGAYYILAILPVTAPKLAETSDPGFALPAGGVAYPDISDPNADTQGYYDAVAELLNATSPDAFTPSIDQLDLLIQSIQVHP